MAKILYLVSEEWYFYLHRLSIALAAHNKGYQIVLATKKTSGMSKKMPFFIKIKYIKISRKSLNPFQILIEAFQVWKTYKREKPDLVHEIALRPIIVGGVARLFLKHQKGVYGIMGMGSLFLNNSKNKILQILLKKLLPFFVQNGFISVENQEDEEFIKGLGVSKWRIKRLPGSGVDVQKYTSRQKTDDGLPIVLLACRLLWSKGIREFLESANYFFVQNKKAARFVIVGTPDMENSDAVDSKILQHFNAKGTIEWWGHHQNMAEIFNQSTIFCLPSFYREGIPVVLLEAMACGIPCITTDMPGCNQAVHHGDNGILIPPKNSSALVRAIKYLLSNKEIREKMGKRGRERAIKEFSKDIVIHKTLTLYEELLKFK